LCRKFLPLKFFEKNNSCGDKFSQIKNELQFIAICFFKY
jgi:hypothetical protein